MKVLHSGTVGIYELPLCHFLGSFFQTVSQTLFASLPVSSLTVLAEVAPRSSSHRILQFPASFPLFVFVSAFLSPMKHSFFTSVLRVDLSKTAAPRGLPPGWLVHFVPEALGEAVFASIATLSNASIFGKTVILRRLHKHILPCIMMNSTRSLLALQKFKSSSRLSSVPTLSSRVTTSRSRQPISIPEILCIEIASNAYRDYLGQS